MKMLQRSTLKVGTILAAVALLAACAAPAPAPSKDPGSAEVAPIKTSLTFSYSAAVQQLEKVPISLALQNLAKDGVTVKESFHQGGEDAVQAVARGESDFGTSNAATVFAAIKKGVPIKAIMTSYYPAYVFVAPVSAKNAGDLDGMRVGIHAKVSSTTLYTNLALAEYPQAKAQILIVPGSANRVQAMIAGQLDASVLQFADWLTIQKEAPGKFHVIYDVAVEAAGIIDSVIFTNTQTLTADPGYVKQFLGALQSEYASVYTDEKQLADDIATLVPKTTPEEAAELAEISIKDKIWPADGGFTKEKIEATLKALSDAELLTADTLPTFDTCCTTEFLKQGK